jgi:hypothetical protein
MKRLIQHFAVAVGERPAFREAIRAKAARGQLVLLHSTRYALPQRLDTLAGWSSGMLMATALWSQMAQEDDIYLCHAVPCRRHAWRPRPWCDWRSGSGTGSAVAGA